jgi:4-amino-4-deoxy-L-arabinose transferase-like glycosyltransferase
MDTAETTPVLLRRTRLAKTAFHENGLILAILALAIGLRFWNLSVNGFGNVYYAAAARSGMISLHNAFFASYDPAGFVSIDKPPVALWIQTLSALILGYNGWALHFPQVIAGIVSVFLLWRIIRQDFGGRSGIVAALALAISPTNVAVDRSNLPDAWLTLCMVASAVVFLRVDTCNSPSVRRWITLLGGAALTGIAFQIKMLAAYAPLPAFLVSISYGACGSLGSRKLRLASVIAVIVVVSASWAVWVDLVPAATRPYVGGSQRNTVYNLIFGYNGMRRLIGGEGQFGTGAGSVVPENAPPGLIAGGKPSITRLFRPISAEQAMWLFPLALFALIRWMIAGVQQRLPRRQARQIILWGGWASLYFFVLSASMGTYHPYYLSLLTPALAALTGISFSRFPSSGRMGEHRLMRLIPVAGVITTALWQSYLLHFHGDRAGFIIALLILSALCGVIVALWHFMDRAPSRLVEKIIAGAAFILLIAPVLWCFGAGEKRNSGLFPAARPPQFLLSKSEMCDSSHWREPDETIDPVTVRYLLEHQGESRFLCATPTVRFASAFIIETGKSVMAIGGFLGTDPILTRNLFQKKVENGEVRFFLDTGEYGFPGAEENDRIQDDVKDSCREVPATLWKSSSENSPMAGCHLFDCQSRPTRTVTTR